MLVYCTGISQPPNSTRRAQFLMGGEEWRALEQEGFKVSDFKFEI